MDIQALCNRLVASDATLTELVIRLEYIDDANLKLILDAAKKNKTVKKVLVCGPGIMAWPLSMPAALLLASVVSEHPEIQEIEFQFVAVTEFGPIALAIQQNRKLTRLRLFECSVTQNLVECIRWLLIENALETLDLYGMKREDEIDLDISSALLGNSSLKELVLVYAYPVFGWETFQVIPRMIRANQDLEIIELSLSEAMTGCFHLIRLIAQAAEGHASLNKLAITYNCTFREEPSAEHVINCVGSAEAIGTMLHNAPALRELSLSCGFMGAAGARHLVNGLSSKHSVVEKLNLSCNKLGHEEASIFARLLVANQNLKSLVLNNNNIGDAGALELAIALRQNNTLELLDLVWNNIGGDGASALSHALDANDALKDLDLRYNNVGDNGATSITEMLTRNESIEKVGFGSFGEKGLCAFVACLSRMAVVKTINFDNIGDVFTSEIGNALVQALELNTTLETFDFGGTRPPFEVHHQITRLLALNHGGRRLLSATGESVPSLNYWPCILARSSNDHIHNADVLFYFLREIPNVLVSKAGSRECKHGDDD